MSPLTPPLPGDTALFDKLKLGIGMTDALHNIAYVNSALCDILAIAPGQILGLNVLALPESQAAAFAGYFIHVANAREAMPYECEASLADGRRIWLGGWLTPLEEQGCYQGIVCTLEDISRRKIAEAELLTSHQRLELALDASGLALWDLDPVTGDAVFNDHWYAMKGYRPGEIPATLEAWKQLIHPEDRDRVLGLMQDHLRGDVAIYKTEYRLRHKQGHWVWVASRGKIMTRDIHGEPRRFIGVHQDISDRQRLKIEGEALLARIEQLIRGIGGTEPHLANPGATAPSAAPEPRLTQRQQEILGWVASGFTSEDIASRLNISLATVLAHRRDIAKKLNVRGTAALTRYAIAHRLVP